jgi:hypothetical protein
VVRLLRGEEARDSIVYYAFLYDLEGEVMGWFFHGRKKVKEVKRKLDMDTDTRCFLYADLSRPDTRNRK